MNVVRKYRIEELSFPLDGVYKFNAQVLISVNGGRSYWYSGIGKFCKTREEAEKYCEEYERSHSA